MAAALLSTVFFYHLKMAYIKDRKGVNIELTVYDGTVMTSFYYASTPTRGKWFELNQPEHKSDDRAGDTATSLCVTNEKDMALQQQI